MALLFASIDVEVIRCLVAVRMTRVALEIVDLAQIVLRALKLTTHLSHCQTHRLMHNGYDWNIYGPKYDEKKKKQCIRFICIFIVPIIRIIMIIIILTWSLTKLTNINDGDSRVSCLRVVWNSLKYNIIGITVRYERRRQQQCSSWREMCLNTASFILRLHDPAGQQTYHE